MDTKKEIITIMEGKRPLLEGYENFVKVKGNYILGNGILINNAGEVIWHRKWKHSFLRMHLHLPTNTIIMDRFSMIGPVTLSSGICAVDFLTGKYRWKYWFGLELFERIAYFKKKKSIKLENIDNARYTLNYLFTLNFAIDLKSGKYVDASKKHLNNEIEPIIPEDISLKKIDINGDTTNQLFPVDINNLKYCFEDKIGLIYGVTKEPNFMLICRQQKIIKQIPLMFDILDLKFYDYFEKGVLLYIKTQSTYKLCVIPPLAQI